MPILDATPMLLWVSQFSLFLM